MTIIRVTTTHNVDIEYDVASVGDRVLATILDWLIMGGYAIAVFFLIDSFFPYWGLPSWFKILIYLPVFLYHLLCELLLDGQSFGKKQLKIKVTKMDGTQPNFADYFLRWVITPFEFMIGSGLLALIVVAANGRGQRIGDLAAGTTVVRVKPKATLKDTVLQEIDLNKHQVTFPEAINLTDKDLNTIKEVLNESKEMDFEKADLIVARTKEAVCRKLGIQSEMEPVKFLCLILEDYNYLASLQA